MSLPFDNILADALTPIVLISGVGLMMLCMTNRYNHTTDRIRELIRKREASGLLHEPDIDREIHLIFKRSQYLRLAMLCLSLSTVCSGLLIATNIAASIMNADLEVLCAFWLILALVLTVASAACFCLEIKISLHALGMAVSHLPEKEIDR